VDAPVTFRQVDRSRSEAFALIDTRPTAEEIETLGRARHRLSGRRGPIVDLREALGATDDVSIFVGHGEGWAPRQHATCPDGRIDGTGVGLTRSAALASTVGELIERYAAWRCCRADNLWATYAEVAARAVSPQRFTLYTSRQYAQPGFHFAPAQPMRPLSWAEAWSVIRQRTVLVPSEFVYMERCQGADCLVHSVSTGLACELSPVAAAVSALSEAIERDGIMIAWLAGLELPRLRPPLDDPIVHELLGRMTRQRLRATVLEASTDIAVPVRIALLEPMEDRPAEVAVGMAAHIDPVRAHRKALIEAAHTHNWLRRLKRQRAPLQDPEAAAPRTFEDHVYLWGHERMARRLDFWRHGPWRNEQDGDRSDQDSAARLREIVDRLARAGFEPLLVDLTPAGLGEVGFHVVRAVVPGLVPLAVGPPCLDSPRLRDVPAELGVAARYAGPTWNPLPHPFP
jgi:ribosomal protein S12 methylthiotransferase accessory factor